LAKLGVIDFSGGYVIHLSAGVAGFTAAYWVSLSAKLAQISLDLLKC
jgi:ammonia channel protein AmtB